MFAYMGGPGKPTNYMKTKDNLKRGGFDTPFATNAQGYSTTKVLGKNYEKPNHPYR
jgi:hypothetical protein